MSEGIKASLGVNPLRTLEVSRIISVGLDSEKVSNSRQNEFSVSKVLGHVITGL
jgi:hypothetical protein